GMEGFGIDGWVLTNTLGGEYSLADRKLSGGWSGEPVRLPARESLMAARAITRLPIISVGGIMDEEEALWRVRNGADLIQIYSGWVFGGPELPRRIAERVDRPDPV